MKKMLAKIWRRLALSKNVQLSVMGVVQDKFLVGVSGVIFNDKNEILLFKHTYRKIPWGLPGGYMKAREHPEEGLEREIEEETGFTVSIDARLHVRTDRDAARLEFCYIGTFIGGEFRPSHEVSEAKFFSFDELPVIMKSQLLVIHEALKKRDVISSKLRSKRFVDTIHKLFTR